MHDGQEGRKGSSCFALCAKGTDRRDLIGTGKRPTENLVIVQKRVAGLSESALERFVRHARRRARLAGAVNVLVTSSAAVRELNHKFRGQNKATDVLSFPSLLPLRPVGRKRPALAGEIAISADVAAQNAARLGHSAAAEIKILALHGLLHLAGFDHERDNGEMARYEMKLRQALKLPVALIERTQAAENRTSSEKRSPMPRAGMRSER
jgi:probable rRNA maturation factor